MSVSTMQIVDHTSALAKIKELELASSNGTTLVSYYIPSGGSISSVSQHVTQELGTAANIKSKTTRKGVQSALKSLQQNIT